MILHNIPLYNFGNGAFMIGLFAVVCVGLVVALFMLMGGPTKSTDQNQENMQSDKKSSDQEIL